MARENNPAATELRLAELRARMIHETELYLQEHLSAHAQPQSSAPYFPDVEWICEERLTPAD